VPASKEIAKKLKWLRTRSIFLSESELLLEVAKTYTARIAIRKNLFEIPAQEWFARALKVNSFQSRDLYNDIFEFFQT
jgi:hypothetical protein